MSLVWDRLGVFLFSRLPGHQNISLVLVYIYHWKNFPMKPHFIGLFVWLFLRSVYRNFLKMQRRYSSNPSFRAIVKSKIRVFTYLEKLPNIDSICLPISKEFNNSLQNFWKKSYFYIINFFMQTIQKENIFLTQNNLYKLLFPSVR